MKFRQWSKYFSGDFAYYSKRNILQPGHFTWMGKNKEISGSQNYPNSFSNWTLTLYTVAAAALYTTAHFLTAGIQSQDNHFNSTAL